MNVWILILFYFFGILQRQDARIRLYRPIIDFKTRDVDVIAKISL